MEDVFYTLDDRYVIINKTNMQHAENVTIFDIL